MIGVAAARRLGRRRAVAWTSPEHPWLERCFVGLHAAVGMLNQTGQSVRLAPPDSHLKCVELRVRRAMSVTGANQR
jgi:hypothetical protein